MMNSSTSLFQVGTNRYQPDAVFSRQSTSDYVVSQQFLAFLVGAVAFLLPVVLIGGAVNARVCFYDSISHFYYSQFLGNVFVGALFFIGTFLMAYRGESGSENTLATIAGFCAYGIALFPTSGAGCEIAGFSGRVLADISIAGDPPLLMLEVPDQTASYFELSAMASALHYISAGFLFSFLAYYCFFVFTRVVQDQHFEDGTEVLTREKRYRNQIYLLCGSVIVIAMVIIAGKSLSGRITGSEWLWWDQQNVTFWLETAILWAFGLAWMVKGRFLGMALLDERDARQQ